MKINLLQRLLATTAFVVASMQVVHAQETGDVFRMHLKSPILFSGGTGDDGDDGDGEVVVPDALSIVLQATSPFEVERGDVMDAIDLSHFASLSGGSGQTVTDLSWSVPVQADLPPGVTLSGSSLVGTPTRVDEYDFEVVARHGDAEGRQVYTIVVNGLTLKASQIALGSAFGCAVTTSKGVVCWGNNGQGQLGDGTTTNRREPVAVLGVGGVGTLSGVQSIAVGFYHACAVVSDGGVVCWGNNGMGQAGDGTTTDRRAPVRVVGIAGAGFLGSANAVSAGYYHTCAMRTGGDVVCWGYNSAGQLGNDDTSTRLPSVVKGIGGVGTLADVMVVAAGGSTGHTCAISSSVGAVCWGYNNRGQLGDGTGTSRHVPVQVKGVGGTGNLAGVVGISAGAGHTCAMSASGAVCWGTNTNGQLGDGTTTHRNVPVQVVGVDGSGLLGSVSTISSGYNHSCAAGANSGAVCWGYNEFGQLGDGTTTSKPTPSNVLGLDGTGRLTGVVEFSGGNAHTCADSSDAGIVCWGLNGSGQLGDGTVVQRNHPGAVVGDL